MATDLAEGAAWTATAELPGGDRDPNRPERFALPATKRLRHGWVLEVLAMAALFELYDAGRDWAARPTKVAFQNARQVMAAERFLGIDFERSFQHFFLRWHVWVSFWNIYYGTVHFIVPVVALVVLYRRAPARYLRWRNAFLLLLALGVTGFYLYPLMPPRLMPARYDFVDTPAAYYNFGPQQPARYGRDGEPTPATREAFGNLYSGLPSLHVGWATWSVLALYPVVRRRWVRILLLADLGGTLIAIYMTGNHRVIDAVAGWVALAVALSGAMVLERLRARRVSHSL